MSDLWNGTRTVAGGHGGAAERGACGHDASLRRSRFIERASAHHRDGADDSRVRTYVRLRLAPMDRTVARDACVYLGGVAFLRARRCFIA